MGSWTTPQDIKDRWRGKVLPADQQLQVFIDDVERQIIRKFPDIQKRIDADVTFEEFVIQNVAMTVIDFLQTDGTAFVQEAQAITGKASRSVTYDSSARRSLLLTDEDFLVYAPEEEADVFMWDLAPNMGVNRNPGGWYRIDNDWFC